MMWPIHQHIIEPSHEIMALFVPRKLILQTRMHSHPVRLDVWFLVWPFVYFHTSCVRTAKALARLRRCASSPEPSLVAYVISTIISWACSIRPGSDNRYTPAVSGELLIFASNYRKVNLIHFDMNWFKVLDTDCFHQESQAVTWKKDFFIDLWKPKAVVTNCSLRDKTATNLVNALLQTSPCLFQLISNCLREN